MKFYVVLPEETDEFHKDDHTDLWLKHKIRERKVMRKRKKMKENEEKNRERIEKLREEKLNCSLLNEWKYNTSHLYIKELHE